MAQPLQKSALTIALVTPEYVSEEKFHGGLANYVHRIALTLRELGHHPHVITSATTEDSSMKDGVHVHKVRVWKEREWQYSGRLFRWCNSITRGRYTMLMIFLRQSYLLNKAVKRLHKRHAFDVVQYPQLGGVGFFRPKHIPSVVRLSSLASLWYQNGGFGESECESEQQQYIEVQSIRKADAVFGPSKQLAQHVSTITGTLVNVIESPYVSSVSVLDDSVYQTMFAGKKYLLFFGSIGHIKGVGTIAEVIFDVLSKHKDVYFGFVGKRLLGQAGGDVMDQVWEKAGEHSNRVLWHDVIRQDQLYPIIQHAQAVVLPSKIDNFPNACLEAMSLQNVVIGTEGNGFEQLIEHAYSGLLCKPGDAQSLLRAIDLVLLMSEAERKRIGMNAAKRIERLHPSRIGRQLVELYQSVSNAA